MRSKSLACAISLTMGAAAASQSSEDIAYLHLNRVKPSMTVQYETARKRHWSDIKKWETLGRFTLGKSCLARQAERTWSPASGIAGKKWMKATKKWVARKMILVLASSLIWIRNGKAITATCRN